jgi:hypothetical protein
MFEKSDSRTARASCVLASSRRTEQNVEAEEDDAT